MMMAMTNTLWLLMGAMLIFFMQAGFSMMETGYTRAKNASNIVLKSFLSVSVSILVLRFPASSLTFNRTGPMVGGLDFFTRGDYSMGGSFATSAFVLFQTVYCAAAVTIVLGAMAERTKLLAFILYGAVIALLIFPVSGHWIWGGGWLSSMGFHDYTGAAVVHMVGGGAAFFGAKLVGPRIGKYNKEGQPRAIPGHNLTQGALGILILWFCWRHPDRRGCHQAAVQKAGHLRYHELLPGRSCGRFLRSGRGLPSGLHPHWSCRCRRGGFQY